MADPTGGYPGGAGGMMAGPTGGYPGGTMGGGAGRPTCAQGHGMTVEDYREGGYVSGWSCDKCGRSQMVGQRWRCGSCSYDVCFTCIPQQQQHQQAGGYPMSGYPPAMGMAAGYPAGPAAGGYPAGGYPAGAYGGYTEASGSAGQMPTCTQFTGSKKALLIGINYTRHRTGRLNGCINDVQNMQGFLVRNYGFAAANMMMLTDDASDANKQPTKANILRGIQWLVTGVRPGDSLFFQFSGHGSQVKDTSGDEDDGYDETICPVDYDTAGMIIDDDLHAKMCMKIPAGARLTAIMDCCHSGTGLDLPYEYHPSGSISGSGGGAFSGKKGKKDKKQKKQKKQKKGGGAVGGGPSAYSPGAGYLRGTTPGDVMLFSGCRDDQTSADATIGGKSTGAMTWALTTCLTRNKQQTFLQLLDNMRSELTKPPRAFTQVPQLSTGRPLNLSVPFSL